MNKKIISVLLTGTLLFSSVGSTYASSYVNYNSKDSFEIQITNQVAVNMSKSEVTRELQKLGFTSSEIQELFEREEKKTFRGAMMMRSFPPNPSVGEVYIAEYDLSNNDLGFPGTVAGLGAAALHASKNKIAKAIVAEFGIPAIGWASMAAIYIMGYINAEQGFSGFNITVKYTYGEDNHMDMSWTPGRVSVERYK